MSNIEVAALSGSIGASVTGVKLGSISDAEFDIVHAAFLEHCVLVFPEQFLSVDDHVAFAGRWGEFSISPFVKYLGSHPAVLPLHNRGKAGAVTENWHTDSAFLEEPPALNVLSARDVPIGGDTMFCNQYRSYDTLSSGMQEMLDGMRAEFTALDWPRWPEPTMCPQPVTRLSGRIPRLVVRRCISLGQVTACLASRK